MSNIAQIGALVIHISGKGNLEGIVNLRKKLEVIPLRLAARRAVAEQPPPQAAPWRMERSGNFAGFVVSGWRYDGLAIWHLKVWSKSDNHPARTFTVVAAEFYPETVLPSEKLAILYLIAMWEADEL